LLNYQAALSVHNYRQNGILLKFIKKINWVRSN